MLLDTDVMVDILRGYPPALTWFATLTDNAVALPGLVAMELLGGCRDQNEQRSLQRQLARFSLHWPTAADCQRAYEDFAAFRLSHNLDVLDALIAHTAVGLGETLATFNVKHYGVITGLRTAQPY